MTEAIDRRAGPQLGIGKLLNEEGRFLPHRLQFGPGVRELVEGRLLFDLESGSLLGKSLALIVELIALHLLLSSTVATSACCFESTAAFNSSSPRQVSICFVRS